jgi:hypothetical protein
LANVLNRHFHVVQTSRITGATTPPPPPYTFMASRSTILLFTVKRQIEEKNSNLKEAKRKGAFEDIRFISKTNAINKYACKIRSN